MRVSENWLRQWCNPDVTREALVHQLTMAGLEVDGLYPVAGEFSGVVVGHVLSTERHPNADKLTLCSVDVGQIEPLTIICGAKNVRASLKVAVATIGACLPGNFKIKKTKLRGVASMGMICSTSELGLAEGSEGIMELPLDAPVGECLTTYMALKDTVIAMDLTPNRGDCLSVLGVAREVSAINKTFLEFPAIAPQQATLPRKVLANLSAPDACPRYVSRVIESINEDANTPLWMLESLRRAGLKTISPVVDVTNYVMLELGQPMHAFDLDKLEGDIQVRMAKPAELINLLDGTEVELTDDCLVIADEQKLLAFAGVMGGASSAIQSDTKNILLEAAFFNPLALAGRARRYGLQSDSAHRFERGVDFQLPVRAIERATELLLSIVGGKPGPVHEACIAESLPVLPRIALHRDKIEALLGINIPDTDVERSLDFLGMSLACAPFGWYVTPPSYRFDIAIAADLIEELARSYGYNNLPVSRPSAAGVQRTRLEKYSREADFRQFLVAKDYQEAITYSFIDKDLHALFHPQAAAQTLLNPISVELSVMRASLWPSLCKVLQYNLHRQQQRVRLFEFGLRFIATPNEALQQRPTLGGVIAGPVWPNQWGAQNKAVDFFDLKGDVESLLANCVNLKAVSWEKTEDISLHPGQSAKIIYNDTIIGLMGMLHPSVQEALSLSTRAFVFELYLDSLPALLPPSFEPLSKFPQIRRDLAFWVDKEVSVADMLARVRETGGSLLTDVQVFDIYQEEDASTKQKSVALNLTLQHKNRTLVDIEVNELIEKIVDVLQCCLHAKLRS